MFNMKLRFSFNEKDNLIDQNENYKIFNVGNSDPKNLKDYINCLEDNLGKKADIIYEDIQPGDVEATYACTNYLENWIKYKPCTSIEKGIKKFTEWYINYYK